MGRRIVDNGRRVIRRGKEQAREEEKNKWRGRKSKSAGQCRLAEGTIQRVIVSRRFAVTSVGENLAESGRRRVVDMGLDDIGLQCESSQNQPDGETPPLFFLRCSYRAGLHLPEVFTPPSNQITANRPNLLPALPSPGMAGIHAARPSFSW